MLSAFQILAKKVPSSLRVSDLHGIQNNPRGGKYLDKLYRRGRHLSNDATNFSILYRFFDQGAQKYSNRNELKIWNSFQKKFASIRIRFANRLFSICIVFCDSKRQFFHFFFQIQELIELNYPSSSFSSFSFPRSSIISRTFYTRIYIYTKIQCKSYLAWAREKRIDHRSIISLQYKFVTHIGETFRNEEEEKEERGIAVTWQLNHPLKSRSNVREREIGR